MNRQKLFSTFLRKTHGKGRAVEELDVSFRISYPHVSADCVFFPENHPGCAIGCQTGFREQFEGKVSEGLVISDLLSGNENIIGGICLGAELREFFGIEATTEEINPDVAPVSELMKSDYDIDFLNELQSLHDEEDNWQKTRKKFLKKSEATKFAKRWGLIVPELP